MNTRTAYLLARLPIGMSMFVHGFERIPKLQAFAGGIEKQFEKTMLAPSLVHLFGTVLPFCELLTGILLLLGLFTRFATMLGVLIMLALIFGSGLLEQWQNVFLQMMYGAYFAALYLFAPHNGYALDGLFKK